MTKAKIKRVVKRLPYFRQMRAKGETDCYFYIGRRRERIVLDDEVKIILEVVDDVCNSVQPTWMRAIMQKITEGKKDVYIMMHSPVGREKYYQSKERLINMIYNCCISRGLVSYQEILREDIG